VRPLLFNVPYLTVFAIFLPSVVSREQWEGGLCACIDAFSRGENLCVCTCIYLKIPGFSKSILACHVVQFGFVFHCSCADITRIIQKDPLFCHA